MARRTTRFRSELRFHFMVIWRVTWLASLNPSDVIRAQMSVLEKSLIESMDKRAARDTPEIGRGVHWPLALCRQRMQHRVDPEESTPLAGVISVHCWPTQVDDRPISVQDQGPPSQVQRK